jgi:hypothetical protein
LQLNKIEKEKVIVINDDYKNTYKKIFNINFNEDDIFTLLRDFHTELQRHLSEGKITDTFNDKNIRTFGIIYTDFRQRTSKLHGNIDRKNLTDILIRKISTRYLLFKIHLFLEFSRVLVW